MSVYDRPEYLKQSLDSLLESFDILYPEIIITDDGSTMPETQVILNDFLRKYYPGKRNINKIDHKGLPFGKLDTIKNDTIHYSEPYFFITDSDMIYKKGWMEILVELYKRTGAPIVTGFNTLTNKHAILEEYDTFVVKESVGGCNLLVDTRFYWKHPFTQPHEWDYIMCKNAQKWHTPGVVCSKPSVVDHIGIHGKWTTENHNDKAIDFNEK